MTQRRGGGTDSVHQLVIVDLALGQQAPSLPDDGARPRKLASPVTDENLRTLDAEKRTTTPLATNNADLLIGADRSDDVRWHWQGMLDDVRIYDSALSTAQIEAVMQGGAPSLEKPPNRPLRMTA